MRKYMSAETNCLLGAAGSDIREIADMCREDCGGDREVFEELLEERIYTALHKQMPRDLPAPYGELLRCALMRVKAKPLVRMYSRAYADLDRYLARRSEG